MPIGPPPAWAPPRPRPPAVMIVIIFVIIFLVVLGVGAAAVLSGGFPGIVFLPFCGVIAFMIIFVVLFVVLAATGVLQRRNLPPPPPIQQPMVPAGTQGPVALTCPNCGAPPQNVDRFGVATCTYCGTRFLVR